jgi:hypothetical protein
MVFFVLKSFIQEYSLVIACIKEVKTSEKASSYRGVLKSDRGHSGTQWSKKNKQN